MKYIVTYDLRKPVQNYEALISVLKKLPAVHAMQSTWFVETSRSPQALYEYLEPFIDKNDLLFVCQIGDWYGLLPNNISQFLQN